MLRPTIWDIVPPGLADVEEAPRADREDLWGDLSRENAAKAHEATLRLALGGHETVSLVRDLRSGRGLGDRLLGRGRGPGEAHARHQRRDPALFEEVPHRHYLRTLPDPSRRVV